MILGKEWWKQDLRIKEGEKVILGYITELIIIMSNWGLILLGVMKIIENEVQNCFFDIRREEYLFIGF